MPRAWSPEDVARFLDGSASDRWAPLWRLAATTGMRRGELVGLRWSDVGLTEVEVSNNRVVVEHAVEEGTVKNRRARRVALDADTATALRRWRAVQAEERLVIGTYWPGDDYVFTWPDGRVVHPDVITRPFKRLRDALELPPLPLHNMRHAWATTAIHRAGIDTTVVARRLGHSSTRITEDIYTAVPPEADGAAAEAVARLYDTPSG